MRGRALLVIGALLAAAACGPDIQDDQELRRAIARSELAMRTFTYTFASKDLLYTVTGAVVDDFRYQMTLSTRGVELVDQIVVDDARSVRLPNPAAIPADVSLGHPTVDAALREGRWVTDPSGAPPLVRTETGAAEAAGDPFRQGLTALGFVRSNMGSAAGVREFNFEAIDYKPSQDPWYYPNGTRGEVRYDFLRPALPRNEDQIGGQQGDITESEFRKLSVFLDPEGRVQRICSLNDIEGHEDFIKLREAGPDGGNPYHRKLYKRIRAGETQTPIEEQEIYVAIDYPDDVNVALPSDAHLGKLGQFELFENEGGLLELLNSPTRTPEIDECDRPAGMEEPPR